MKKIKHFLASWGIIILVGILLYFVFKLAVNEIPGWYKDSYTTIYPKKVNLTPQTTSYISNTFSATLGPLIAMLAAYLTFIAFWIQYRANKIQSNYIKQQRFEDTFFRLVDLHKRNLDSMDIRDAKDKTKILAIGNESFRAMYEDMESSLKKSTNMEEIKTIYDKLQVHYKTDLHHYFRFLYHTLKFIKNAEISEQDKFKYSSILRATLSAYELALLFYNGIHPHGITHFKPLIEYFSFLKNLDTTLLFNEEQMTEYHKLAYAASGERKELLKDWIKTASA
jgi:hypothetical protein